MPSLSSSIHSYTMALQMPCCSAPPSPVRCPALGKRSSGDGASVSDYYPPTSPCLCRAHNKYSHLSCHIHPSFFPSSPPPCRPWLPRLSSSPRSKPAVSFSCGGLGVNKFEKVCVGLTRNLLRAPHSNTFWSRSCALALESISPRRAMEEAAAVAHVPRMHERGDFD
jgi:hypothetical protein